MDKQKEILFLSKLAGPAVWGDGSILKRYPTELPKTEARERIALLGTFSGDETYPSIVLNGRYQGLSLADLYKKEPELFGREEERKWGAIPISVGVGYAEEDLSIQVHPTESYAQAHEGCHGKSECWYIVDVDESPGDVVLGHTAKTLAEFRERVEKEEFDKLLLREPVHKGDFFNLQAGTLHALQKGTTFIEVCTACNLTYRLYDYHRKDHDGQERRLDLPKVYENVLIPYEKMRYRFEYDTYGAVKETQLTDNENFSVRLLETNGRGTVLKKKPYYACFVIKGEGSIEGQALKAGDNFLLTSGWDQFSLDGNLEILAAHG